MVVFYVSRDSSDRALYVMRAEGGRHATESGPWRTSEVAWKQCENAAHRAALARPLSAVYTVMPDNVQQECRERGDESASRAAWIVQ